MRRDPDWEQTANVGDCRKHMTKGRCRYCRKGRKPKCGGPSRPAEQGEGR